MNTVILLGNLTRDVEVRFTQGGSPIGSFGIAVNRKWKDSKTNEAKEEVTFIDITAFGKQAELIAQYFKKGSKILLTGRLKMDQWDDKKTNQKRSKLGVVLESFEFVGGKSEGGSRTGIDAADVPRPLIKPSDAEANDDSGVPF